MSLNLYPLDHLYNDFNTLSKLERNVPGFIRFLQRSGYKNAQKVFDSIGLSDISVDTKYWISSIDLVPYYSSQIINIIYDAISFKVRANPKAWSNSKAWYSSQRSHLGSIINHTRIFFSANPCDISTMSMRGVSSCMHWSSRQSITLTGSVLDPYCAIIWLGPAAGWTEPASKVDYGSEMLARCVVRYVFDREKERFAIFLEPLYIGSSGVLDDLNDISLIRKMIMSSFKNFIKDKTKLEVITSLSDKMYGNMVIPTHKDCFDIPYEYNSYRDSSIRYAPIPSHVHYSK